MFSLDIWHCYPRLAAFEGSLYSKSGGRVDMLGAKNALHLATLYLSILRATCIHFDYWLWAVSDLT